jgi:hypothetical protein
LIQPLACLNESEDSDSNASSDHQNSADLLHALQPGNSEKQCTLHSLWQAAFVRSSSCKEVEPSIPAAGQLKYGGRKAALFCLKDELQSFRKVIVTPGMVSHLARSP